jgi:hypothetical protein
MSASNSRKINIHPQLFKLKSKTMKTGKHLQTPIDTSKIKEQLTSNIMKRRKQKLKQQMEMEKKKEASEFDKSFNFMLQEKEKDREGKEKQLKKNIKKQEEEASSVVVNVEWPTEEPKVSKKAEWSNTELIEVPEENVSDSMMSYVVDNEIKYGCLKGGLKKTFKNLGSSHPHNKTISPARVKFDPAMIAGPTIVINPSLPAPAVAATSTSTSQKETPPPPAPAPIIVQTPIVIPAAMASPPVAAPLFIPPPPPIHPSASVTDPLLPPTNIPTTITTTNSATTTPTNTATTPNNIRDVHVSGSLQRPEEEYVPKDFTVETPAAFVPKEITEKMLKEQHGGKLTKDKVKEPSIKVTVKRKTMKYNYKLGKSKTLNNRITILSTSKSRIKVIEDAKKELQKTPIEKMRTYLMDRNLLASGSSVPNDVLKKMYVEANIAADITNHNNDTLLENYIDKH